MAISSQASNEEGSETTGLPDCRSQATPKRPAPASWGDDIVQSSRKREAVLKLLINNMHKSPAGCWEWKGGKRNGYGSFALPGLNDGKKVLAHRASWIAFKSEALMSEQYVCHHCDNPKCFNPDHLFIGDANDNMQDCKAKGRLLTGELSPNTKHSKEVMQKVAEMLQAGFTGKQIKEATNVSLSHISRIRKGYTRVSDVKVDNWVHPRRKSTDDQLQRVAKLLLEGQLTAPQIAEITGVSRHTIGDMRKGKCHKKFMERASISD